MAAAPSERVRSFFDPQVASRGEELAKGGAVTIRAADAVRVRAVVRGRLAYDTALTLTRGRALVASCTCASAALAPCKHAWATLRIAESRGLLEEARHANDLALYAELVPHRPAELRYRVDLEKSQRSGELSVQLFENDGASGFREVTGRRRWELQKYSVRALAETEACEVDGGLLSLDDGEPFRLVVDVKDAGTSLVARAWLERDGEVIDLERLLSFQGEAVVLRGACATRVVSLVPATLLRRLREGELEIPEEYIRSFLRQVLRHRPLGATRLPPSFRVVSDTAPIAHVHVRAAVEKRNLPVSLSFDYGGVRAAWPAREEVSIDPARPREIVVRSAEAERRAVQLLVAAGVRSVARGDHPFAIPTAWLPKAVEALPPDRFVVEADGIRYHASTSRQLTVSSGIDWLELEAAAQFGTMQASLPALLAAAKGKDGLVRLGDGHVGVLPQAWLAKLARLESLAAGEAQGTLRFGRPQVSVVDALLPGEAKWSGPLAALREALGRDLPSPTGLVGFTGTLRDYQRAGVAWLQWLARLGFGGCLADDMGLGKTVQVLALLADRHARRPEAEARPSLVVAPRSVVPNWIDEARRFAPWLCVRELGRTVGEADLFVTTYETLRRHPDRAKLSFDYVVLDEAHAIKNAESSTSQAMYELTARHRVALTGTPLENHLGEVASLFHFLNPGMFGHALRRRAQRGLELDPDTAARLGRGLRPFVLRRTKEAVLTDLPPLVEQMVPCAMSASQRAIYERAKRHYQTKKLDPGEMLAALLRLRQLACHPGLVDEKSRDDDGGKLEVLLDRLDPLMASGKKVIVFSQFTSLLDLVEARLRARAWSYARLDGQTPDRRAPVKAFQDDPSCLVMLVSLRAGGTGLNLTSAEYVFLLDPWWNPAVEAQAMARAHRIGQRQTVFAFRMVATDSIEEKVIELQKRKQVLAESIFDATESATLGRLTLADLEELLR